MAIGAVGLVALFLFADREVEKEKEAKAVEVATGAAMTVTPEELRAAYEANEAGAQQTYGDAVLEVSGTIDAVTLDFGDDPVIRLTTAKPYDFVHANLAESAKGTASSLSKGQRVTLRCAGVSEVIGTPILKECIPG